MAAWYGMHGMCRRLCLGHCMKAAATLAGLGSASTWQDALKSAAVAHPAKLDVKVGDSSEQDTHSADAAVRTVQRCLLLLSLAAETGQVCAMLLQLRIPP